MGFTITPLVSIWLNINSVICICVTVIPIFRISLLFGYTFREIYRLIDCVFYTGGIWWSNIYTVCRYMNLILLLKNLWTAFSLKESLLLSQKNIFSSFTYSSFNKQLVNNYPPLVQERITQFYILKMFPTLKLWFLSFCFIVLRLILHHFICERVKTITSDGSFIPISWFYVGLIFRGCFVHLRWYLPRFSNIVFLTS